VDKLTIHLFIFVMVGTQTNLL